ncbi:DUF2993 domain-containing protein [Streptomyces sp. SID13726]|uniref:LmeA family phospholipid-binding protein n=1 Tax=Streptomyces sp. SID13726 TaxID=2706058 RepID=UPI0013B720C8|nr:DUF2993 domain-containing protein [Streptomyces sp. SID13726]NEB03520.1 DUF2993 domain-containing protein [Streptomyces sp. SID13726]
MYESQYSERYADEPYYGDGAVYVSPPTPSRRRLIVLVAVVTVSALGFVAVDRIAAERAENRTAEAFQDGMGTAARPSVHVSGFPVLTQLARGRLDHVDLTAHGIPANGSTRPLPVTRLTVGVDGLSTSGSADVAHARSVDATAFLSYEDLSNALGVQVSRGDGPDRVEVTASLPVAGDVTVSAAVTATSGNRIAFSDIRSVRGEQIPVLKALLDEALREPMPLRNVPQGLSLRSVTTTDSGIEAHFTGSSVTFRPDSSSA